jgi:hypothetical protein
MIKSGLTKTVWTVSCPEQEESAVTDASYGKLPLQQFAVSVSGMSFLSALPIFRDFIR